MLPRLEPEERLQKSERIMIALIGGVVFGGFALDLLVDFAWLKAGALVMFVAWFALIGVHELGHAAMAAALGWRVCRIVIGMGKPLLRFRVAGVPVQVCRYPVGGHVVPAPRVLEGAHWKSSLIFAAGPAAELLVLLGLVMLVGFEELTGTPQSFAVLSAQATAVAALLGVVLNLIPLYTHDGSVTDGLGMLSSLGLPREAFQERQALPYTTQAESLLLSGRRERAVEVLRAGSQALGDNLPALVRLAQGLLDAAEPQAVVELLDPLVKREDVPKALQPAILVTLSTALVWSAPERLSDADDYTEFAFGLAPDSPSVKLGRARVLLALERLHPAATLAAEVRGSPLDDRLTDARDALLAQVELRRGQRQSALALIEQLDSRGARGPELDLARRELGIPNGQSQKYA